MQGAVPFFGDLPTDVLSVIAGHAPNRDVFKLVLVGKAFGDLFKQNLNSVYYKKRVEDLAELEFPVTLTTERWKSLLWLLLKHERSRSLPKSCRNAIHARDKSYIKFGD